MPNVLRKAKQPVDVGTTETELDAQFQIESKAHKFLTTRRYPIYYLAITKCGSTFLKNLFYALDNDAVHPNANRIHDYPKDLLRATDTPRWMIRRSRHAFTVIRNPVDRFLSMYFDKIYASDGQNFPDLRQAIALECGLNLQPGLSAEEHQQNCLLFLDWLKANIAQKTKTPMNPHWRPQMMRIGQVSHLKIGYFTLDGLEWQMPEHFHNVIPDLAEKMTMVRTRNTTRYPVDKAELKTPEILAKVAEVYTKDTTKYEEVSNQWRERKKVPKTPLVLRAAQTQHVLTTHRFNINAVVIPKAGCTYIRNLFYALDHGRAYPKPAQIDTDTALLRRNKSAKAMENGCNFVVIRDPVHRFFSFYFEKIWNEGDPKFVWIPQTLAKNRKFRRGKDLSLDEHHDNCLRLLGFLENRFEEREIEDQNAHWRPQFHAVKDLRGFGFSPVTLDQCREQITRLSQNRIRGLDAAFDCLDFKNESTKPEGWQEIISLWIRDRIEGLYAEDIALYERVRAGWANDGMPPAL